MAKIGVAILRAWECGTLLLMVKAEVGHGKWEQWLAENVPQMERTTAWRYRRLATKYCTVQHLRDALARNDGSMRDAFTACGALPEPESPERGAQLENTDWIKWKQKMDVVIPHLTPGEASALCRDVMGWFDSLLPRLQPDERTRLRRWAELILEKTA